LRRLNERIHLLVALQMPCSPWEVAEFGCHSALPPGWGLVALASVHKYQYLAVVTLYIEQVTC